MKKYFEFEARSEKARRRLAVEGRRGVWKWYEEKSGGE
jgi:hypothetical protein